MSKRVMICDDEIHIVRAAEFKLQRAGYEVEIASDGEEAWERIQTRTPDMLVTDCQMPRLDGLGLIRRLRGNPATRELPILMLSGKGFELSAEDLAREWNVLGVVAKPFSPRELLQTVEKTIGAAGQCGEEDRRRGATSTRAEQASPFDAAGAKRQAPPAPCVLENPVHRAPAINS